MSHILALDQGTTSSRALVFDIAGQVRGLAQQEFIQYFPHPGWVEHDASEIWSTQLEVARQAIAAAGLSATDIAAIGITNQRETTVVWDRVSGNPIHRAIVWQDRRTADLCARLKAEGHEPTFRQKTGLRLDPYFSGTKLRWLLDNVDGARSRAERGQLAFGTIDTWLVWQLTGGEQHLTDATNASRTLLYNLETGTWDRELLDLLNIPATLLPEIRSSSEVYGTTDPGLFQGAVAVAGIAGDQQAALFGQVCTEEGMAKNTYGTGCFMLQNVASNVIHSDNNLLTTVAWQLGDERTYALEGSIFVAGAVVQWLRDGLGLIATSGDVEPLALSVDGTDGVFLVPAFTGLGAPHWDPHARGLMIGLTRGTTAAHIARAALESIAYQSADVLLAIQSDAGKAVTELRVDGGASQNDMLMQFQADLLGVPVVRTALPETTALGAAYLAGLAVGLWDSPGTIASQWRADRCFEPKMSRDEAASRMHNWHRAVERSTAWAG